jgi:hypothetical protein
MTKSARASAPRIVSIKLFQKVSARPAGPPDRRKIVTQTGIVLRLIAGLSPDFYSIYWHHLLHYRRQKIDKDPS